MEFLIVAVLGLLGIAGASMLGSRFGVAPPLLLVVAGLGISLLPFVPQVTVDPEWILAGIIPPLLYSASVSMPTMDFRREFGAISGLSIVLVVVSAVILGVFFALVIPGLGIWWGIALGAIVSPTDAVATSIVKKIGLSGRVVAILEGESMLNDATALVLLRTAVAAAAASVSFGGVVGGFAYAVIVAVVIGYAVGKLNLFVRQRVADATVNTVISFTVPFLASIPADALGASGLVAAVVAGLVTGHNAPRMLAVRHRLSDRQNWQAVELVLEGTVFLLMGLELTAIVGDVREAHTGLSRSALIAAGALMLTVVVRAAFVAPLLLGLRSRAKRGAQLKPTLAKVQDQLQHVEHSSEAAAEVEELADAAGLRGGPLTPNVAGQMRPDAHGKPSLGRITRVRTRVRRTLADIDYFLAAPLGWREGSVVVWAGMRGAITVAAAQTLPADTPDRSLLVFIAFLVAGGSLLIQGGTLKSVVKLVKPKTGNNSDIEADERSRIFELLDSAAASVPAHAGATGADAEAPEAPEAPEAAEAPEATEATEATEAPDTPAPDSPAQTPEGTFREQEFIELASADLPAGSPSKRHALAVIKAQREALLDARDDGLFSSDALGSALAVLDADQMSLELRGVPNS